MSDTNSTRHHHHHHSGSTPRSSRAEGLSDAYKVSLDSSEQSEEPLSPEEQELLDNLSSQINQQLEESEAEDSEDRENQLPKDNTGTSVHHHSSSHSSSSGRSSGKKKRKKKHMDAYHREKRRSRILIRVLIIIVILLLALIGAFLVLRYMGEQNLKNNVVETPVAVELPEEVEEDDDENLIVYNGERYWYNEDIITLLCIGVDRQEFASPDDMVIGENGQADADVLVIFDKNEGKISFLNISRDTMVDLDRYNIEGQYLDTVNEQLCLSYAFGNGEETSCENTALSVSRLLYGMPINAYMAIDFESIATLNDAVGGVTVPVTEDIAEKFPDAQVGSMVTLVGSEAVTYVRYRDTAYLDSNNTRMSRQKTYVTAFLKQALTMIQEDPTKTLDLFNSVSDSMVTSLKISDVTYFGSFFASNGFSEDNMTSVQGEVVEGEDGYAEFHADETALFETVLDLFYIKE